MSTESWVLPGPQILDVEDVRSLRVQVVAGRVDVVVHDDDAATGARLEVHSVRGRPLEVTLRDGELAVGYSFTLGGWEAFLDKVRTFTDKDAAEVHIAVPRHVAVRLGTVSADALVAGVRQDVSVSTVSGQLAADSTRGALRGNTVSGEIVVRDHAGDLRLNTVSGDLTASGVLTRVNANSVSGDLTLDVRDTHSAIAVSSVSGDVTVRLPAGAGVRVEARSATGRTVVDGRQHRAPSRGGATEIEEPGHGPTVISTTSVSGHVTVLRGSSVPSASSAGA
ncbi:DUF4097 family beta strand repeat protein [Actinotalea ferrariae]|uniref:DUF4097 family beta strand repeat-containing protein n=1 Tax=Actinotalea ferrariae TaxID=1386098 RepID=UPI001C8C475B|nr:DUF4097 family beta strand repeat-containing protein [Actinotalea ferrariae]MBX9245642.1 DUF4097 family beta strand repeat protein [Actinotalea ferrariae]